MKPEADLLYVYFEKGVPNINTPTHHDYIWKFVSKKDKNHVIGFEIKAATEVLDVLFSDFNISTRQQVAIILFLYRKRNDLTQEEMASLIGYSLAQCKRVEKAEVGASVDIIDNIYKLDNITFLPSALVS